MSIKIWEMAIFICFYKKYKLLKIYLPSIKNYVNLHLFNLSQVRVEPINAHGYEYHCIALYQWQKILGRLNTTPLINCWCVISIQWNSNMFMTVHINRVSSSNTNILRCHNIKS